MSEKISEVWEKIKTQFGVVLYDRIMPILEQFGLFNESAEAQEETQEGSKKEKGKGCLSRGSNQDEKTNGYV